MEIPYTRTPGPKTNPNEVKVTPCNEAVVTPGTPLEAVVTPGTLLPAADPPPEASLLDIKPILLDDDDDLRYIPDNAYEYIRETLGSTDSDMEEFEDVIFGSLSDQISFRNSCGTKTHIPLISFNDTIGEWGVMGFDVPNSQMLESLSQVSSLPVDNTPVFFTPTAISNQYCSHQRDNNGPTKCPCLDFKKTSTKKFVLDKTLFDDLELIRQEICCAKQLGHDLLNEYRSHKAVVLALTTQDKNIRYEENHPHSLKRLYAIRTLYGMDKDFGQRFTVLGEFSAQFETDWLNSLFDFVKQTAITTTTTLQGFVKGIFEKISDVFKNFIQLFSSKMTDFLNSVMKKIYNLIWDNFKPLELLKEGWKRDDCRKFIVIFSVFLASVLIDILGFVTVRVTVTFCKKLESMFLGKKSRTYDVNTYYAQAPDEPSPLMSIITVIGAIMAISTRDLSTVARKARDILALCNLGKSVAAIAGGILIVAPTCLRDLIDIVTQPTVVREKKEIDQWLTRAHAVISISKISRVIVSDRFNEWLNELYQSGRELRSKLTDPTSRILMSNGFNQIIKLKSLVTSFKDGTRTRRTPHSVHIAGAPGIAKTTIARRIIRDVYDISEPYVRSVSDAFWSGYTNQGFVLIDEFLAVSPETNKMLGEEYLTLVSPCIFKPNMGSVEDPAVGLKGTTVSPRGVMTINNHKYTVVSGLDREAIWRRREFVVELKVHPDYSFENNRIDFTTMSYEDISQVSWLLFDVYPPTPNDRGRRDASPLLTDLTYAQLIAFWRDNLNAFETTGDNISRALGEHDNLYVDIDALLEEEMRSMYNIPSKPQSVKEAISKLISDLPFSSYVRTDDEPRDPDYAAQSPPSPCSSAESEDRSSDTTQTVLTASVIRKNTVKFRKWIKEYKKPTTSSERRNKLGSMIKAGYKPEWLGDVFYNGHAKLIFESIELEPDYLTADDDELDSPRQVDVLTDIVHSNVDFERSHRHSCTVCARAFAHRHGRAEINHKIVCTDCANMSERLITAAAIKDQSQKPTVIDRTDLVPEDLFDDCELYSLTEDEMQELRERVSRAFVVYYYDYIANDRTTFSAPPFTTVKRHFVSTFASSVTLGVGLYLCFRGIRAVFRMLMGDVEEDDEVVFSQSPYKSSQQPNRSVRARNFRPYRQQSGSLPYVTMEIRGVSFTAFPIMRNTMMTYEHAFSLLSIDRDGDEPITFIYNGTREIHRLRSLQVISEPTADVMFITLPRATKMNSFPNNMNRFWSDFDVKSFESCAGVLETAEQTHAVRLKLISNRSYTSTTRKRTLEQALGYQAHTKRGDCGSILVASLGPLTGRFLGMHVAGGEGPGGFFGMSTIVTREMIEEALNFKGVDIPDMDFSVQGGNFEGPNLRQLEHIPRNEVVHLSRKSKIKPSVISSFLPWKPQKHPPIMEPTDPRCDGQDPVVNMLNDTLSVEQPDVDKRNLKVVLDDMKHFYRHKLNWPIGKRFLTIEEALGGIPGLLASMKLNSSAGYPLVRFSKKRGKRDWYYFDEQGNLVINDCFREMVKNFLNRLNDPTVRPEEFKGRFLVYLKDELTTQKKIDEKRCRLIFGGDLIANTAFRMLFGSFIIAFQRSYRTTPSAIGLNQYSYDMELIYQYLIDVGENFIAGDFKNFDKKMVKQFQLAGYELISTLCDYIPRHVLDKFIHHQTESPLQVFNNLLYLKSSHFSGCFFTTILNVFVHEAYIRYVFRNLCPGYVFEEHMRMKILGDDHIYSVSDELKDHITPITIAQELEKIGQTYTSDDKLRPLDHEHRKFDEITFLGAHPIDYEGKYVGALKKDTLKESILWTRNHDNTILQECKTAMELMSAWGPEAYNKYYQDINNALGDAGYDPIDMPSQTTMIDIVANRTAASECAFPYVLVAQGDDAVRNDFGLTKLNERHTLESTMLNNSNKTADLSKKAMAEMPMSLDFSTDSNVWRSDFTWNSSQPAGTAIYTIDVPFGLLNLGNVDNIQNMPFDRYTYWTGDVEVTLQINGQPFQQGLLAMYFMPLANYECELTNITTTNHVLLTPGESSTASLTIPFIYPRTLMNTYASATESLGTIYITPLSPLQSVAGNTLNVSVFSRFPNSSFRIPKINPETVKHKKVMWGTPQGSHHTTQSKSSFFGDHGVKYQAQGAGQSTTVSNTYYNAGGVMPIQDNPISIGQDLGQQVTADLEADVSAMPLDNPPLCSGSFPLHQTFSGMSASHGVRPTTDMQLFPSALSREPIQIFNPVESKISTLLGKKCLLTSFNVASSDAIGKLLYSVQLNTRMGLVEGSGIPFNVALINQFMFWRAHMRFEVVAVRTKFHSTRLNAVVTYGAPVSSESLRTVAFSHMIDFSGENSKFDFDVEWNAQTEFLRIYEGDDQVDPVQNYSLGNLSFYLTNALVAPESVEPSHQVLVFLRFVEPRVAVPRPYSPFSFNGYSEIQQNFVVMTIQQGTSAGMPTLTVGLQTTFVLSKSDMAFNPAVPANGNYDASGNVTLRYRDSSSTLLGSFLVNALSINVDTTTVTVTFVPVINVPTGAVQVRSTASFESMTILDVLTDSKKDRVLYYAQGEDIPPSQEDGTQPQDESVEAAPTTHDNTVTRVERPCKLEIGRKFEFIVSDIHEIGRRYHKIKLVGNNDLDQFALNSQVTSSGSTINFVNFSVQVQSYLRSFFAVWAGSVKYRVFNWDDNVGNIVFVPYLNTAGKICVPIIDALKGESFTYNGEALTSLSSVSAPMARERLYPISTRQFIDVSAPFQTHFNFCYNSKTQNIAPIASGTMALSYSGQEPEVYTAFGDDLRLGVYRPPQSTKLNLAGFKDGVAGFFAPVAVKKTKPHYLKKPIRGVDLSKTDEPGSNASTARG